MRAFFGFCFVGELAFKLELTLRLTEDFGGMAGCE
jgi:hypothetical protein